MVARPGPERAPSHPSGAPSPDAVAFVRFCYARRRMGWPELYDEMCGVAGRGLFRGWGSDELAEHGIELTLFGMPALAALVNVVLEEERPRQAASLRAATGA